MLERVKFKSAAQRAAAAPAFDKEQSAAAAGAAQARGRRLSHGSGQLLPSGTVLSPRPSGSRGAAEGLSPPRTPGTHLSLGPGRGTPGRSRILGWDGRDTMRRRRELCPGCSCSSPGNRLVTVTFHRGLSLAVQGRARSVGIRGAGGRNTGGNLRAVCCVPGVSQHPPSREQIPDLRALGTQRCLPAEGLSVPVSRSGANPKSLLAGWKPRPCIAAPPHSEESRSSDSTVSAVEIPQPSSGPSGTPWTQFPV